jgi:hypothetical protein
MLPMMLATASTGAPLCQLTASVSMMSRSRITVHGSREVVASSIQGQGSKAYASPSSPFHCSSVLHQGSTTRFLHAVHKRRSTWLTAVLLPNSAVLSCRFPFFLYSARPQRQYEWPKLRCSGLHPSNPRPVGRLVDPCTACLHRALAACSASALWEDAYLAAHAVGPAVCRVLQRFTCSAPAATSYPNHAVDDRVHQGEQLYCPGHGVP